MKRFSYIIILTLILLTGCAHTVYRFNYEEFMIGAGYNITSSNRVVIEVAELLDSYSVDGRFNSWFDFEEFRRRVMKRSNEVVGKYCEAIQFYSSDEGVILSITCNDNTYQEFKLTADFIIETGTTDCIFKDKVIQNPDTCTVPKAVDWTVVCENNVLPKILSDKINDYLNRLVYIYEKYIMDDGVDIDHFNESFEIWRYNSYEFRYYGVYRPIVVNYSQSETWSCIIRFPEAEVKVNIEDKGLRIDVMNEV